MQKEKEAQKEKTKKEKYKKNLTIFEKDLDFPDFALQLEDKKEVDECILDMKCLGDCDPEVHQAKQLQDMKSQGGRKKSPQVKTDNRAVHRCPQCDEVFQNDSVLTNHMKLKHGGKPNCPFCNVGFWNLKSLKKHIDEYHSETPRTDKIQVKPSKGVCIFFMQAKGCKKGTECDYSHERSVNSVVEKIPKLCQNSRSCRWKPRCRYIHAEDGETMPQRAPRERTSRVQVGHCYHSARECPRGGPGSCRFSHKPEPRDQGFGSARFPHPPPGYRAVQQEQQQQQVEYGSQMVMIQVPLNSLREFPSLPVPKKTPRVGSL